MTTTNSLVKTGSAYAGGGTYELELEANLSDIVTRIHFRGRSTGSIQVNAWIVKSDRKESLGTINLAEHGNMITSEFALKRLEFIDSGSGPFHVVVDQGAV